MPLLNLSGKRPRNLGVRDGRLPPCPSSPNCVSSDAGDDGHRIPPLAIVGDASAAWRAAREAVAAIPRTTVVTATDLYLHAECSTALLGFVDDLELHLRPAEGVIAVRSASRVGYGDLGMNRKRVEGLRRTLAGRGVVSP